MANNGAIIRCSRLLDVVCSIPALNAAARQAGKASTSGAHTCNARVLGLPFLGVQCRHTSSSVDMLPQPSQSCSARELGQALHPFSAEGCRTLHTHSMPGRAVIDAVVEESVSCGLHEHHQRRTAFGLPNLNGDPSKKYHERRLIGYSQEQLYAVVAGVEHYKEFVPWCQRSHVIDRKPPGFVEAELEVGFKMFVERYTSQVHLTPPGRVISRVYDSTLFDHLDSTWDFQPGPTPHSTWLSFTVDFAFKSPLYHHIATVFFDEVVKRMMGAFETRCQQLYGSSAFRKVQQKQKLQTA